MKIAGDHFTDDFGRHLILRGLNLGGDSKVPTKPDGRSHLREGFYEGGKLSFVGRPFPLEEADEHFARLSSWGQRFLRLLVTWEAVEHEGPDTYDYAYLDYLEALAEKAAHWGVNLFIDPHQDVWSRWTGGDGAPLWTLEALGFEPRNFQASGAALLHQEMGPSYPRMEWFSNHSRLACATMFSLFFAGNDLAPGIHIEGSRIQDYLQEHYIAAMRQVVRRLAGYPSVAGIDSLNEPGKGFIGIKDISAAPGPYTLPGLAPSPWEAMRAGEGFPVEVNHVGRKGLGLGVVRREVMGSPGLRAWRDGELCLWRRVGVWDIDRGEALLKKPDHFAKSGFNENYLKPFLLRFAREIRAEAAASAKTGVTIGQATSAKAPERNSFPIFIEGPAHGEAMPSFRKGEIPDIVNAAHWYDALTLTFKRWTGFLAFDTEKNRVVIGPKAVRSYFRQAMERILEHSWSAMGGIPSLLGEFGLPFDLNGRRSFASGDYGTQEKALAAYYDALDATLMNATLWNYSAGNTHAYGDGWNGEDLSVFSNDEIHRPVDGTSITDLGGRALRGFVRPYAMATAGRPLRMSFNRITGKFRYSFEADFSIDAPTEVFVPSIQYPKGYSIRTRGCRRRSPENKSGLTDSSRSMLFFDPEPGIRLCEIIIERRK